MWFPLLFQPLFILQEESVTFSSLKKKKDIFPMLATVPEARVSQAMEIIQILSQQNISQSHREGFGVCYKSISQVHL